MPPDLKYAFRRLRHSPGFTITALLTLALGIGVNTSMFSLLNSLMLRPLAFNGGDQLVQLHRRTPQNPRGDFAAADYVDLKREETGFGQVAAYGYADVSLAEPHRPAELVNSLRVSADFFNVLQIQPEIGRTFHLNEDILGNQRVVVLSHALWQERYASDPAIIGRTIRVNGEAHEIVGVLPASAYDRRLFGQIGVYYPLGLTAVEQTERNHTNFSILGRRSDTVSPAQGETFLAAFGARLAKSFPSENIEVTWHSEPLLHSTMNPVGRAVVGMLLGLSAFVLLIACSNLANLLLSRALSRGREFAVRAALGAARTHLVLPLMWEAILLAGCGGLGAMLVSRWTLDWISAHSIENGGQPLQVQLDWRVLAFTFGVSALTAFVFGIAPALFATQINLNDTLKGGARGSTAGPSQKRTARLLIVGQFTLAMILVAGAGFFLRGAKNAFAHQHGWEPSAVVQASLDLPTSTYRTPEEILQFQHEAMDRLWSLPGVESVSASDTLPYSGLAGSRSYLVEGRTAPTSRTGPSAQFNGVSSAYFRTTGTRLIQGRYFSANDVATSPKVVVISESLARALFPNETALGHRIAAATTATPDWAQIVGVVADVHPLDFSHSFSFQVYHPLAQEPHAHVMLAVRVNGTAIASLAGPMKAAIATIAPDLPLREVLPVELAMSRQSSDLRLIDKLLRAFALLGLFLAAIGIYGVMSRTVAQRKSEIGVRLALGAQQADILRMILGAGLRLALIGCVIGLAGAFGLWRILASGLPALQTDGGLVLAGGSLLLTVTALFACWLPAADASRVDPVKAIHAE